MGATAKRPGWATLLVVGTWCVLGEPPETRGRTRQDAFVLPPVPGARMRQLLDPGPGKLPGGYRLHGARIQHTELRARYRSSAGGPDLFVVLAHPTQPRGPSVRTTRFALRLEKRAGAAAGPKAQAVLEALAAHVRSREAGWKWVRARDAPRAPRKASPPGERRGWAVYLVALLGVLMLSLLGWAGYRRFLRR